MKTEIEQVGRVFEDVKPALERALGVAATSDIEARIDSRREDASPVITLFGTYNAGKSTLVNALIGAERAAVSDRPETAVVQPYSFGGVTIFDTPGIDAPFEHEAISREHLKRSDIVLFVVGSNGMVDERRIYDEIAALHTAGKKVLLIVNNKDGFTEADQDYLQIQDKVLENLQAAGDRTNLPELHQAVPVRLVNAQMALKARLEGKQKLLEASHLPALMTALEHVLAGTGAADIARSLGRELATVITAALDALNGKSSSKDAKLFAEIEKSFQAERDRTTGVLRLTIGRAITNFRTAFRSATSANDEEGMQQSVEAVSTMVNQTLERELTVAAAALSTLPAKLKEVSGASYAFDAAGLGAQEDGASVAGRPSGTGPGLFSGFDRLIAQIEPSDIQDATLHTLEYVKKIAPDLMKGIGKKTMGKIAERVANATPLIGPAIEAVSGIWNYYEAHQQEQAIKAAHQKRESALSQMTDRMADDLESEMTNAVAAQLRIAFQPIDDYFSEQRRSFAADTEQLLTDVNVLEVGRLRLAR